MNPMPKGRGICAVQIVTRSSALQALAELECLADKVYSLFEAEELARQVRPEKLPELRKLIYANLRKARITAGKFLQGTRQEVLAQVLEAKRAWRRKVAKLPIKEKMKILVAIQKRNNDILKKTGRKPKAVFSL